MEEKILLRRAQQGDTQAFDELFAPSRPLLLAHCVSLLHDSALAEDMVQETALKALKSLPNFQGRSSLPTWLWRIAHNLCMDELRRKKEILSTKIEECVSIPVETVSPDIDWNEWLHDLSPAHREVMQLFYIEKMAQKEIAERLHLPIGTVRSRLYYAKKKIKSKIQSSCLEE